MTLKAAKFTRRCRPAHDRSRPTDTQPQLRTTDARNSDLPLPAFCHSDERMGSRSAARLIFEITGFLCVQKEVGDLLCAFRRSSVNRDQVLRPPFDSQSDSVDL